MGKGHAYMAGGGRLTDGLNSIEELVVFLWIYSQPQGRVGSVGILE